MTMIDQGAPETGSEAPVHEPLAGADDPQALRNELRAREAERQRLEQELGAALEDRTELDRELEEARGLLLQMRKTLDAQQGALRHVYGSRSWRMTRPIRGMGDLTRRLLGRGNNRPQLPS
jgi:hypothetical protein